MNNVITKNILICILLIVGLTNYTLAEADLPVSAQLTEDGEDEKIEIIQEIKIETTNLASNPKLKEGIACSEEELEKLEKLEVMQGSLFTEIPMAITMPCDKVDCNDLAAAKMYKDNYRKLRDARTISCGK